MPKSKTQGRNSSFDPSAPWLSLHPYWKAVERVALAVAKRYQRRPFPKSEHYRFRERLHNALSRQDPNHLVPYTALAYYGLLLACYHRLRRAETLVEASPTQRNRRVCRREQRACELIWQAYRPLMKNYKQFLEQY